MKMGIPGGRKTYILCIVLLAAAFTVHAQYQLDEYVIASAGGHVSGGIYTAATAAGQPVAGGFAAAEQYRTYAGFFHPSTVPVTAAPVEISGRVKTYDGPGIPSATVTLMDYMGVVRVVTSDTSGNYRFTGISAGMTCILTVRADPYVFAEPSIVVNAFDSVSNIDFVTIP